MILKQRFYIVKSSPIPHCSRCVVDFLLTYEQTSACYDSRTASRLWFQSAARREPYSASKLLCLALFMAAMPMGTRTAAALTAAYNLSGTSSALFIK